jgi:hypothetical protein
MPGSPEDLGFQTLGARNWRPKFPGIMIGNAGMVDPFWQEGDQNPVNFAAFQAHCGVALGLIASKPVGERLLTLISTRCQGVGARQGLRVIICCASYTDQRSVTKSSDADAYRATQALPIGAFADAVNPVKRAMRFRADDGEPRRLFDVSTGGASCLVRWSPFISYEKMAAKHPGTKNFVALAHELIHAYHFLSGNRKTGARPVYSDCGGGEVVSQEEEFFTVGLGQYEDTPVSENKIREEHDLPRREFYYTPWELGFAGRGRAGATARR